MKSYQHVPVFIRIILFLLALDVIEGYLHTYAPIYYWPVSVVVILLSTFILYKWLSPLEKDRARASDQEIRLKSVLDTVNTAIATITEEGTVESFNDSAQRMFGYSAEEVIGKNVKMLMPDEHKHRHDGYLQNYKNTGKASIIGIGRELVGVRKNGETFPLSLHVGQVNLDTRRIFTGVMEDLSKLKASEESEKATRIKLEEEFVKAAEQKVRLESIVNTVGTAIITITDRGIIESFNEAAQRIFGYSDTEVFGKNVKMLMPDEHKHQHDGYLHSYSETGKASIIGQGRELIGVRKGGREFPMYLHVGKVDLGARRIFTGAIEDLSDLKQAQFTEKEVRETLEKEKLRLEEQDWIKTSFGNVVAQLRAMTDMHVLSRELLDNLLPLLDAQLGVFYLNNDAKKSNKLFTRYGTYGYTSDKNHNEYINQDEGLIGEAIRSGQLIQLTNVPENYAHRITSSLGSALPRQVIITPIMFENNALAVVEIASLQPLSSSQLELLNQVTDTLGLVINRIKSSTRTEELLIETQKQAELLKTNEEELRIGNEELTRQSAKMEERNNELIIAQAELEETSRYKSEFLANMSHELRTPLNSLLILSKILADNKDGNLTTNQVKNASTVHQSGNDLLELINDILDLSKVEAGQMEANLGTLSFSQLANDIEESFVPIAEEKNIEFNISLHAELPQSITTDEQRLMQILRNFLSNAFKFTQKGRISLDIGFMREAEHVKKNQLSSQHCIAFSVSDTGIGIPEDKQNMIFLAFQQLDSSIQREYGGTGLGLSISKQLADLLQGEIHLNSVQGEGSTFTLYVPNVLNTTTNSIDKTNDLLIARHTVRNIKSELLDDRNKLAANKHTILLVEDDPKFALVVSNLVRENGFNVLLSSNGNEGYELAKKFQPIGIIVDLTLEGASGQAVIAYLKDDPATRHIPIHVVAGTGNTDELKGKGVIGFMQKPVSGEQLISIFKRFANNAEHPIQNLLIVEDNEVQAIYVKELVDSQGIEVTLATTAKEAKIQLQQRTFDCMVLDLALPDMDGLELLQSVSRDSSLNGLPVVVYTAKNLTQEELIELKNYADTIIQKSEKGAERLLYELVLFLHRAEAKLPDKQRKILEKIHNVEAILNKKKVLLVDDDMRNIYALSAALEEKCMDVVVAKNGIEALEKLTTIPNIDIVLMDIMMPEMDGYEAMRKIRTMQNYQNIPIIALTAKVMSGDRQHCIDAGASDYISKPIEVERLFSLMRVWLY